MANNIRAGQNTVSGLGTFQVTIATAGVHFLECKSIVPTHKSDPLAQGSNLQIVIKQNGTTLVTVGGAANNPTQTQHILEASKSVYCAVGDIIQFVLSSNNAIDSFPNKAKSQIGVVMESY